jgi:hypothetical protein
MIHMFQDFEDPQTASSLQNSFQDEVALLVLLLKVMFSLSWKYCSKNEGIKKPAHVWTGFWLQIFPCRKFTLCSKDIIHLKHFHSFHTDLSSLFKPSPVLKYKHYGR